jgi:hypothetical protein
VFIAYGCRRDTVWLDQVYHQDFVQSKLYQAVKLLEHYRGSHRESLLLIALSLSTWCSNRGHEST